MVEVVSWLAVAIIVTAIAVAWSGRFLAVGALTVANLVVFALQFASRKACTIGDEVFRISSIQCDLSARPELLASAEPIAFLQLVTSMFVHADIGHIIGNLIILLAFALPFEERVGARTFVILYVVGGLAGGLLQIGVDWGRPGLLLGASGAVFAIIGAFAGAFPNQVIAVPVPIGIIIFVRMKVWMAAALFGALQFLLLATLSSVSNVAYLAHIGGLVAGLALARTFVRRRAMSRAERQVIRIDIARLAPFATSAGARRALQQLETEADEPDVFEAWLERFLRDAACPQCGRAVALRGAHLVCSHNHRFDIRRR